MDIVVLIKQVPDTATRIQDRVKNGQLELEGVTWVTNPYDEYAVEEALRLKERLGGTVTLVALGPERVQTALKDMLALGADEAVHVWDPAFAGLDSRATALVLAAAVKKLPGDKEAGRIARQANDPKSGDAYLRGEEISKNLFESLQRANGETGGEVTLKKADGTLTKAGELLQQIDLAKATRDGWFEVPKNGAVLYAVFRDVDMGYFRGNDSKGRPIQVTGVPSSSPGWAITSSSPTAVSRIPATIGRWRYV